jgi:DNA-binding MarR family transcriptional regulator
VTLTPNGTARLTALTDAAAASQRTFLRGLSAAEQDTLLTLLTKVIDAADSPDPGDAKARARLT